MNSVVHTLVTRSCICVVDASTHPLLLINSNIVVSWILVNGCRLTTLGLIRRRRSSCGLVHGQPLQTISSYQTQYRHH